MRGAWLAAAGEVCIIRLHSILHGVGNMRRKERSLAVAGPVQVSGDLAFPKARCTGLRKTPVCRKAGLQSEHKAKHSHPFRIAHFSRRIWRKRLRQIRNEIRRKEPPGRCHGGPGGKSSGPMANGRKLCARGWASRGASAHSCSRLPSRSTRPSPGRRLGGHRCGSAPQSCGSWRSCASAVRGRVAER